MKLKKVLGVITAIGAMALMCVGVQAATYSVESASANAGDSVTLKVQAAPNAGESSADINGFAVQIAYDANVLTPVKTGSQDATGADTYASNLVGSGVMVADVVDSKVAIAWADASAKTISTTTNLAEVTFKVADGATVSSTDLTVTVVAAAKSADALEANNEVANGTITLGSNILYGDVDNNGSVTSYDASLVSQYNLGLLTFTEDQLMRADVDGSGSVSSYDASLISQFNLGLLSKFPVEG